MTEEGIDGRKREPVGGGEEGEKYEVEDKRLEGKAGEG